MVTADPSCMGDWYACPLSRCPHGKGPACWEARDIETPVRNVVLIEEHSEVDCDDFDLCDFCKHDACPIASREDPR